MNRYLQALLAGSYLWYFAAGLLGPLYTVFAQSIGGDLLDAAFAYSAYLIATGVFSMLFGALSDRCSKEAMMLAGYSLNVIGTFSYLFVAAPHQLFATQVMLGVATALA